MARLHPFRTGTHPDGPAGPAGLVPGELDDRHQHQRHHDDGAAEHEQHRRTVARDRLPRRPAAGRGIDVAMPASMTSSDTPSTHSPTWTRNSEVSSSGTR